MCQPGSLLIHRYLILAMACQLHVVFIEVLLCSLAGCEVQVEKIETIESNVKHVQTFLKREGKETRIVGSGLALVGELLSSLIANHLPELWPSEIFLILKFSLPLTLTLCRPFLSGIVFRFATNIFTLKLRRKVIHLNTPERGGRNVTHMPRGKYIIFIDHVQTILHSFWKVFEHFPG
tara:strand:- start:117 stop:650 length:534 start_codon:yes stop_codon:yes gene_type:complete